jgi:hypothetical protein
MRFSMTVPAISNSLCAALIGVLLLPFAVWSQTNVFPASGNVGIGTATPAPGVKLDVYGSANVSGGNVFVRSLGTGTTSSDYLRLGDTTSSDSGSIYANSSGTGTWYLGSGGPASTGLILDAFSTPIVFRPGNSEAMRILTGGNVGIGTTNPAHMLQVAGTIGAKEVIVSSTGADYVFEPGYQLKPLDELAAYVNENRHLPDVPSAKEMKDSGVSVGEMQTKLLAKIEELTLHMIEMQKENRALRGEVSSLRAQVEWVAK